MNLPLIEQVLYFLMLPVWGRLYRAGLISKTEWRGGMQTMFAMASQFIDHGTGPLHWLYCKFVLFVEFCNIPGL